MRAGATAANSRQVLRPPRDSDFLPIREADALPLGLSAIVSCGVRVLKAAGLSSEGRPFVYGVGEIAPASCRISSNE